MTKLLKQIRILTIFFIVVLVINGITAFPVYSELQLIINAKIFPDHSLFEKWLENVWIGVKDTHEQYPFIFYGFDWLAFAHLTIAILFIGIYKHPVRNRWIIQWAMITCICVLPLAFIAGTVRAIPLQHILIDCSFGVLGLIPLRIMQIKINKLQKLKHQQTSNQKNNQ